MFALERGGVHKVQPLHFFAVARGIGCRGFLREGEQTLTWEMLLRLKQDALKADNVVSLSRRRR